MNAIVEIYRRRDPEGSRELTDDQITLIVGDRLRGQGDFSLEEMFPEFRKDYLELKKLIAPSLASQTKSALAAGTLDRLPAMGYALGGMGAEAVGADGVQDWFLNQVRRNHEEAAARNEGRAITRVEDIDGVGDFFQWALPTFAENAPQLGVSIGLGVAGGPAGVALGIGRAAGMVAGAGISSIGLNTGEQYSNLALDAQTKDKALKTAFVGGTAAGLVDMLGAIIPAAKIAQMFPGLSKAGIGRMAQSVMGRSGIPGGIQGFVAGGAGEGVTETIQEAIAIAGEEYASGQIKDPAEIRSRLLNAGMAGAVVGAPVGGVFGALPSDRGQSTAAPINSAIEHPASPAPGVPTPTIQGPPPRPLAGAPGEQPMVGPDGELLRTPTNVAAPASDAALVERARTQQPASTLITPQDQPPPAAAAVPAPTPPVTPAPAAALPPTATTLPNDEIQTQGQGPQGLQVEPTPEPTVPVVEAGSPTPEQPAPANVPPNTRAERLARYGFNPKDIAAILKGEITPEDAAKFVIVHAQLDQRFTPEEQTRETAKATEEIRAIVNDVDAVYPERATPHPLSPFAAEVKAAYGVSVDDDPDAVRGGIVISERNPDGFREKARFVEKAYAALTGGKSIILSPGGTPSNPTLEAAVERGETLDQAAFDRALQARKAVEDFLRGPKAIAESAPASPAVAPESPTAAPSLPLPDISDTTNATLPDRLSTSEGESTRGPKGRSLIAIEKDGVVRVHNTYGEKVRYVENTKDLIEGDKTKGRGRTLEALQKAGWRVYKEPWLSAEAATDLSVTTDLPTFDAWWTGQTERFTKLETQFNEGRLDQVFEETLKERSPDDWVAVNYIASLMPGDRSKALYGLFLVPDDLTPKKLRNMARREAGTAEDMLSKSNGKILGLFTSEGWAEFKAAVNNPTPSQALGGLLTADELLYAAVSKGGDLTGAQSRFEQWAKQMVDYGIAKQANTVKAFMAGKRTNETELTGDEPAADTSSEPDADPHIKGAARAVWDAIVEANPSTDTKGKPVKPTQEDIQDALYWGARKHGHVLRAITTISHALIDLPQIHYAYVDSDTKDQFERAIAALAAPPAEQVRPGSATPDADRQAAGSRGAQPVVGRASEPKQPRVRKGNDLGAAAGAVGTDAPAAAAAQPATGDGPTAAIGSEQAALENPIRITGKVPEKTSAELAAEAMAKMRAAAARFAEKNANKFFANPIPQIDAEMVQLINDGIQLLVQAGYKKFKEVVAKLVEGYGIGISTNASKYIEFAWNELRKSDPSLGLDVAGSVAALTRGKHAASVRPPAQTAGAHLIPNVPDAIGNAFPVLMPEQKLGVNLMLESWRKQKTHPGFILGDGTGFGKTMEILAAAHAIWSSLNRPVLVVTLNRQILERRFAEDAKMLGLINQRQKYTDIPGMVFATYNDIAGNKIGTLLKKKGFDPSTRFAAAFFDEAHTLRERVWKENATGKLYRNAVSKKMSDWHVFATATTMDKLEQGVYFLQSVTGKSEEEVARLMGVRFVETETSFGEVSIRAEPIEGISWEQAMDNMLRLRDELIVSGQMIRRYFPFYGDMREGRMQLTEEENAEYQQILEYWMGSLRESGMGKDRMNLRAQSPKERTSGRFTLDVGRWLEPKKARGVFDQLKRDLAEGYQVVVMSEGGVGPQTIEGLNGEIIPGFLQEMELMLTEAGIDFAQIYGTAKKSNELAEFQAGNLRVALATVKSGGTGIDLDDQVGDAPRKVYVVSLPFSGLDFDQVIGRFSRRNTMSPTQIVFVTAEMSAELKALVQESGTARDNPAEGTYFRSDARRIVGTTKKLSLMRQMQSQPFDPDKMLGVVTNPDDDVGPMEGGDPTDYGEAIDTRYSRPTPVGENHPIVVAIRAAASGDPNNLFNVLGGKGRNMIDDFTAQQVFDLLDLFGNDTMANVSKWEEDGVKVDLIPRPGETFGRWKARAGIQRLEEIDNTPRRENPYSGLSEQSGPNMMDKILAAAGYRRYGDEYFPLQQSRPVHVNMATDAYVQEGWGRVLAAFRRMNIPVRVAQQFSMALKGDFYQKTGGRTGDRMVELVMANILDPNKTDLGVGLHEFAHVLLLEQDPQTQEAVQRAISRMTDQQLGIDPTLNESLTLEEGDRLMQERLVESIAAEGVEKGIATGIAARLWMGFKGMLLQVLRLIFKPLGGPMADKVALAWLRNRVWQELAREDPSGLTHFLGGAPAGVDEFGRWLGATPRVDENGVLSFDSLPPDTNAAFLFNLEAHMQSARYSRPIPAQPGDTDNTVNSIHMDVAALNHRIDAMNAIEARLAGIKDFAERATNSGRSTGALFRQVFGIDDPSAAKQIAAQRLDPASGAPVTGVNLNQSFADFKHQSSAQDARRKAYIATRRWLDAIAGATVAKRADEESLVAKHERQTKDFLEAHRNYMNAEGLTSLIGKGVRKILALERRLSDRTGRQLGAVMQQLRSLDNRNATEINTAYAPIFENLYRGLEGRRFFSLIEWARENSIDFTQSASDIRDQIRAIQVNRATTGLAEQIGNPARALTENTNESRALLATLVAYAKGNDAVITQIERRRLRTAEERVRLDKALEELLKVRGITDQSIKDLRKSATLEERSKIAYRKELNEHLALERKIKRRQGEIEAGDAAVRVINDALEVLSRSLPNTADVFTFGDGMTYPVPPTPESKPSEFETHTIRLDSSAGPVTSRETVIAHIEAMTFWMAQRKADNLMDANYRAIEAAREQLMRGRFIDNQVRAVDAFSKAMILTPVTKTMTAHGTPAARSIAQMVNKETVVAAQLRQRGEELGDRSARLRDSVMRALGGKLNIEQFGALFSTPTRAIIEHERGVLELSLTDEQIKSRIYRKVTSFLLRNPRTAPIIRGNEDAFIRTMKDYIDSESEISTWLHNVSKDFGLQVRDEAMVVTDWRGKNAVGIRDSLPQGLQTFSRRSGQKQKIAHEALKRSKWALAKDEIEKVFEANANGGLDVLLGPYFQEPTVIRSFVEVMAMKENDSMFDAPVLTDGVTRGKADPVHVQEAYGVATVGGGFSFEKFANALYELHGGVTDRGIYAQEVFVRMVDTWARMHDMVGENDATATDIKTLKKLVPGVMIDSRQLDNWPSAWTEYIMFDRETINNIIPRIAAQIAFGRDQENLASAWETVDNEIKSAEARLVEAEAFITPGATTREAIREMEQELGKEEFRRLRKIRELAPIIQNSKKGLIDYYRSRHAAHGAVRFAVQLIRTIVQLLLNQPATALLGMSEILISPFITHGVSKATVKQIIRNWKTLGEDMVGSLGQSVGLELFKGSRQSVRYNELGLNDALNHRRFLERIDGKLASDIYSNRTRSGDQTMTSVSERGESWATRLLRAIPEAAELPVRLGQVENSKFTAFTPFAPFRAMIRSTNRAHTISLWGRTEDMVWSIMELMANKPEIAADSTKRVTAADLGLKGLEAESFKVLDHALFENYQVDVTQLAREARGRGAKADTNELIDDRTRAVLHAMALNEIALEPNLATMNPRVFVSTAARMMMPLWGWPLRRAMQVAALRLDTEGKVKVDALARMALTLAVASAAGMAFSILIDEYHEEILRKKRNLRSVKGDLGKDPLMTMLEVTNRMGTFGVFGELMNFGLNVTSGEGDNRGISLDERIVGVNALRSLFRGLSTLIAQDGTADYAGVIRPVMTAVGGNGAIQYWQLTNNALGLNNVESRYTARIHAGNYMRVQGRGMDLEVRRFAGGVSTPNAMTPHLTGMVLASYANDSAAFYNSYLAAIAEAREAGKEDPLAYVKDSYRSRHPLRSIFRSITESDYRRLLAELPTDGRSAVTDAIESYNRFASLLDIAPYHGSAAKNVASQKRDLSLDFLSLALPK